MHKNSKIIQKALDSNLGDMYESFSKNMAEKTLGHIDARKANIASRLLEKKVVCPKCKGDGCDHCDDKGYHLNEASQRFGGDTNIPASPEIKKHIESGKAKILMNVKSALHPSARFLVIKNPKTGANQDKVLMAITSDPERGRMKMFSFHGTHTSEQGALKFAKNHKLITKPVTHYQTHESVELDEGKFDYDPRIKKMSKKGKEILAHMTNSYETATHDDFIDHNNVHTLPKSVVQKTLTMASKERNLPAKQKKELALIKKELGESVELDEAESIHWNKMKKDERVSLLKDSGLPSSFAKDNWKGLDHRAKERMGKYVNKSTKGEYALRP